MKHLRLAALLGAVTFLGTTAGTFAQTAEQPAPAKTEKAPELTRTIKIKNLSSALIAYWLDPKHNPRPVALGEVNSNRFGAPREAEEEGTFSLPGDIAQITSIDAQNVILVTGGVTEDVNRLEELIDVLDQPLRQVELEAQFVEIDTAAVEKLGIRFSDKIGDIQIGSVRDNFYLTLNGVVASGQAKIIGHRSATAINNLTADMKDYSVAKGDFKITPTINGDDTITLLSDLTSGQTSVTSVTNVRDGATIVLSKLNEQHTIDPMIVGRTALVFVTAHIIRRVEDEISVPGK